MFRRSEYLGGMTVAILRLIANEGRAKSHEG